MIQRIKRYMEIARRRAQILGEARKIAAALEGEAWAAVAAQSPGELMNTLMGIGLAHLIAVKCGQKLGRVAIAQVEKRLAAKLN